MRSQFKTRTRFGSLLLSMALGVAAVSFSPGTARGVISTLTDGNSSISFDPTSSAGINNWTVDGHNQINQEWFWLRLGGAGPAVSIDTLSSIVVNQPTSALLNTTYANSQVSVTITYGLLGGTPGSGISQLSVQVRVSNLGQTPLQMQFFNYGDFSLGGGPNTVQLGKNVSGLFNEAVVSGIGSLSVFATPGANHGEASLYPNTLNEFSLGSSLNDSVSAGPGHATWAFEWDRTLAVGGSFEFSTVSELRAEVPDHPARSLIWIALGGLMLMSRMLPGSAYCPSRIRLVTRR